MGGRWPLGYLDYRKRVVVVVLAYLLYGHTLPLCVSLSVFLPFCVAVFVCVPCVYPILVPVCLPLRVCSIRIPRVNE